MKIQVAVFWVVTLCSSVVGYQCFRGLCCLHLHGDVVSYHITTQCHNPQDCNLKFFFVLSVETMLCIFNYWITG